MSVINRLVRDKPPFIKKIAYSTIPFRYRYGAKFGETYDFLSKSKNWSTQRLLDYQFVELQKLLWHAYKNVPYYTKVFNERGITPANIRTTEDIKLLPILTKEIIRDNFEDLIATNVSRSSLIDFKTSGSTGNKLHFIGTDDMFKKECAFVLRAYEAHGATLYDKPSVWLRRYSPEDEGAPLWYYDYELKRLYMSAFHLTKDTLPLYLEEIAKHDYHTLVGYPSSVYMLATFLEETKNRPPEFRGIHVASEKVLEQWKNKGEEILGTPVKSHYGQMEKVSLFFQTTESDHYTEALEYGVTEFVPQEGENLVVATGFLNYAMPFIRYRMNDTAILLENSDINNVGLPTNVADFNGRCDDILRAKNGAGIPGVNFYTMMYKIKDVKMFQINQKSSEHVVCKIVPIENSESRIDETISLVKAGLTQRLGELSIDIKVVDHIERNKTTGKIRCIFNEIQ